MTDLLLEHVHVIDPSGPHHGATVDILIRQGRVVQVAERIAAEDVQRVRHEGLHASPGWVDTRARFHDPGAEWKQGLRNGLDAAAAGGFTAVAVLPGTQPPVDQRSGVEYLMRKAEGHAVRVLPIGAITKGLAGQQLAEHYDMQQAGAVAFSDDMHPLRNARLMLLALQYVKNFGGRIITFAQDPDLLAMGQMHESAMSTRLGLRGIPPIAETIQLARDLELLEYSGSHMHVACVSTAGSVELLRNAKARGLQVTASVNALHLLLDDGCLRGFDPVYKVMPPLRDPLHIDALRDGVKDGTIDSITSDHYPEDLEHKRVEFPQASFGALGLETAFAAARTVMAARMPLAGLVDRFCHGPRKALGLEVPHIAAGSVAEISLFDPNAPWTPTVADLVSRSHNSPLLGQPLTGRPLGIIANGQLAGSMARMLASA